MLPNILLLLMSFLFLAGSIEGALRIINPEKVKLPDRPKTDWALVPEKIWTEHDPLLGWSLQKNKDAVLKIDHGTFPMKFNSLGIRGEKEYSFSRNPEKKRILVVGDSFPFGWGVLDQETFSAQLESRNPDAEVINTGVPGYGIDQMYLSYLNLGMKFQPDVVLVGLYPEDFWRATRAFSDTGHTKPYFTLLASGALKLHNSPAPPPFSLTTNQFPPLIEKGRVQAILNQSYLFRFFYKRLIKLGKSLKIVDPNTTDEWVLGKSILRALTSEIKKSGATPLFFIIPPERWVLDSSEDSLRKAIKRFANDSGVLFVDFTPELKKLVQESTAKDYYIPNDLHWTAKTHAYISQRLAQILTQDGYALN